MLAAHPIAALSFTIHAQHSTGLSCANLLQTSDSGTLEEIQRSIAVLGIISDEQAAKVVDMVNGKLSAASYTAAYTGEVNTHTLSPTLQYSYGTNSHQPSLKVVATLKLLHG